MFVVLAQATASQANEAYPTGEIHSALLFVACDTPKQAKRVAVGELAAAGWSDPRVFRVGEVDPESVRAKDASIREAYASAEQEGAAIVVYREPDDAYVG